MAVIHAAENVIIPLQYSRFAAAKPDYRIANIAISGKYLTLPVMHSFPYVTRRGV
jgi:hypothetical protein